MRAFLLGLVFIGNILVPAGAVLAQSKSVIPEFNSLCWREQQCLDVRANILANGRPYNSLNEAEKNQIQDGFVEQDPCSGGKVGEKWGKCLPATTAKTMIAFGGKREFLNIGEFIQANYTYVITLAAILAVVMIIVAGFQWVMSGGNSEAISSAKNRISGAMIGLFIAYTSYFILTTINPNLVNLSLPNTWMIRPMAMVPVYCNAAPPTTMFDFAADSKDQDTKVDFTKPYSYTIPYSKVTSTNFEFFCGHRFVMKDGGEKTCFGKMCSQGNVCMNFGADGKKAPYSCRKGNITGNITLQKLVDSTGCIGGALGAADGWESGEITDEGEHEIWVVCNSGKTYEVPSNAATYNIGNSSQQYVSVVSDSDIDATMKLCGANNVDGFVMTFEMNEDCSPTDEDHVIGKCPSGARCDAGMAVDLGPWDFFTIGNNSESAQLKKLIDSLKLKRYFITENELKTGFQMDMDAGKVTNVGAPGVDKVYNNLGL